ncbi:LysR family transcriptional regulator [Klebsiella pneumoniae]|nr:LysR family transcriptional regulator [Klebsiella pneumoniae]
MAGASSVDFRALQLFIAVYDNQSFSVVARREGVSPSLISRTIQQLEDALGQQLFYRNTRAVVPTEAGRLFAASARELLGQYADAQRALQDRAQVPGGLVRINAPVYFGQRHIAPWLPELAARHPKLQFDLTLTDDFIDPHRDATDILFRISSLPDAGYHARVFGSQRYYLTASPEYVSRYGSPTSPEALHQHRTLVLWRFAGSQPLAVSPARRGMGALSVDPAHDLEQCRCPAHFSHRRDGDRVISRLDGQRGAAQRDISHADGSLFGGHQPHAIVYRGDLSLYPPSLSQRADSD